VNEDEYMLQKLERAKRQELETEEHMRIMGLNEKDRLLRDIKRFNKDLGETRDRCSMYEVFTPNITNKSSNLFCPIHCNLLITLPNARLTSFRTYKAPFIATELNSTGRPVELSCVTINGA